MRITELLSPAKNLECGLAAINHGADAVYIGASQFSARAAAGNSIQDIEQLCKYAHKFRSKVFVTLNTVLTDNELEEAEKLIGQIYEAGADALIVQDMGILKLDLPPITLHASTQTDNRDIEKVRFLQDAGFSRVVLARELSLNQIKNIAANTDVELEAFIHGALCVSYSGQCYISQAMCGRSANRGACAQFCRLHYDLLDNEGNVLVKNKHLLSLKDLNLSAYLKDLIEAGVTSFKIEGRLKDVDYVKNVTAYYRKEIDVILESKTDYKKASEGKTTFFFEPDLSKSFNRGFTDYFIHERQQDIIQPDTPKSLGEFIGKVNKSDSKCIEINTDKSLHNGDGLCFINSEGTLEGFRVNRAEYNCVFPAEMPKLAKGTIIYRNLDAEFDKILKRETSERKIHVNAFFRENDKGFSIELIDEEGISITYNINHEKQEAKNPDRVIENLKTQLGKTGNTIYEIRDIDIQLQKKWFFPNSLLSEWRRQAVDLLDKKREEQYKRPAKREPIHNESYHGKSLTYLANVTNKKAKTFYKQQGVEHIEEGFETEEPENVPLMFCKHCIKYTLGYCTKDKNAIKLKEPLSLRNNGKLFMLTFDCKNCEMQVSKQ